MSSTAGARGRSRIYAGKGERQSKNFALARQIRKLDRVGGRLPGARVRKPRKKATAMSPSRSNNLRLLSRNCIGLKAS